jgi:putative protease
MPYDLISDGKPVPLGDRRYLLSPRDLAGIDVLPELARAGIASLKIEGRLKAPEYVANITRIYREALDQLRHATRCTQQASDRYSMEMAFSRGLHTGWFGGIDNQSLVHARFGKKRGVYLGRVARVHRDRVTVALDAPLKTGDGVVFDAGRPEDREEGGRVYEIRTPMSDVRTGSVDLLFGNDAVNFSRIQVGDRLWKTSDPVLEKQWRQSFKGDKPRFQRPILMEVHGVAGKPLSLIARDEQGHVARTDSSMPLTPADKQPLTPQRLREQLGRLGGTPFKLDGLRNELEGDVMLPVSELNRLRRELVTELDRLRSQPQRWTLNAGQASSLSAKRKTKSRSLDPSNTGPISVSDRSTPGSTDAKHPLAPQPAADREDRLETCPTLIILVRNLQQLEAALRCGAQTLYCDFENPKKYRDAVDLFRTWQLAAHGCGESQFGVRASGLFVAPPRIFKPGEEWQLEQVRSRNADGYLVRNYDHLGFFANERCVGDHTLNVANHRSADYFRNRFGLQRVTASYDLNFQQLEALLAASPPEWFEITIHQHMPMFHMEHCVFCAFLTDGRDYRDCGRPCDNHDLKLRDRVGAEHPVKADVGCRNTVFNALAQTGAEYVDRMLALGARHLRIEFLNETPGEVERIIATYRRLLRREITGTQLWKEMKLFNQLGVTRGTVKR